MIKWKFSSYIITSHSIFLLSKTDAFCLLPLSVQLIAPVATCTIPFSNTGKTRTQSKYANPRARNFTLLVRNLRKSSTKCSKYKRTNTHMHTFVHWHNVFVVLAHTHTLSSTILTRRAIPCVQKLGVCMTAHPPIIMLTVLSVSHHCSTTSAWAC